MKVIYMVWCSGDNICATIEGHKCYRNTYNECRIRNLEITHLKMVDDGRRFIILKYKYSK